MSTEQANGKTVEEKKEVAEVTEKLENLAVDNTNEANENKPARRGGPGSRGRGRGRGGRTTGRFQPRPPYEDQIKQIEEDLKSKKVIEKGVKGYVKWFSVRGRYGFVAREKATDETEDFFVHQTAITKSSTIKYYLRTLEDEEPVVFDIVEGRKGAEAANVTGPDGENVRGSRFARSLLTRWGGQRRGGARGAGGRKPREENGDENEKPPASEERGDGETRGKRRPKRARGKLQPDTEDGEKPQEKGDGDAVPAAEGEKKGRRRIRTNKGKKEAGEANDQHQEAAPTKA